MCEEVCLLCELSSWFIVRFLNEGLVHSLSRPETSLVNTATTYPYQQGSILAHGTHEEARVSSQLSDSCAILQGKY